MERFKEKIWLSSPKMHGDELKYVTEAYETNWMSTVGTNINEIERTVAEKIGCKYAVALSCGTAALHLCIKLAGIKPGDAVLINFVCSTGLKSTDTDVPNHISIRNAFIRTLRTVKSDIRCLLNRLRAAQALRFQRFMTGKRLSCYMNMKMV